MLISPRGLTADEKAVEQERVLQWIDDLSSASFAVRENASEQLFALGHSVLPDLHVALRQSTDAEQRERLEKITTVLAEQSLDLRIQQFLEGDLRQLENWDRMEKWFGDSPRIRELFVDLYRDHPVLIRSLDGNTRDLSQGLQSVSQQISNRGITVARISPRRDLVAMLLPMMQPDYKPETRFDILVLTSLRGIRGDELDEDPAFGQPLRKMVGSWMNQSSLSIREGVLDLALEWDLDNALELAKATLSMRPPPNLLCRCIQAIAKLGSREDAQLLGPFLDSRDEIFRPRYVSNRGGQLQVGDVAAAAIAKLNEVPMTEIGFAVDAADEVVGVSYGELIIPATKQADEPTESPRLEFTDDEKSWMSRLGIPAEDILKMAEKERADRIRLIREFYLENRRRDAQRDEIHAAARELLTEPGEAAKPDA
ncbi:MAG: hypothetical protein AAFV88_03045 [Planctomycetota bacterium]